MSRTHNVIHLALATVLIISGLAGVVADSVPATATQETAIRGAIAASGGNSGPNGVNAIQAPWQTRNEVNTLYLLSDKTAAYNVGGSWTNHLLNDPSLLVTDNIPTVTPNTPPAPPTVGFPAATDQDSVFALGPAVADTEVYSMGASLSLAFNQPWDVDVRLELNGVTAKTTAGNDAVTRVSFSATGVDAVDPVIPGFGSPIDQVLSCAALYGGASIFSAPVAIKAGQNVSIRVHALPSLTNQLDTLDFQYGDDCSPSTVTLIADTARVSGWTEDLSGKVSDAFPVPAASSTTDRTIQFRLAHIESLGSNALDVNTQRHFIRVVGPDQKVYYDNSGASAGNPNLIGSLNVAADQKWGAIQDDLARSGNLVTSTKGLRVVEYRFLYPATLALQGVYTIEVGALGESWKVAHKITIGGVGAALTLSPLEQSPTKEILIGQRTTFRVTATNQGGGRDTLAIIASPASVPIGWSTTVSPASLALDPGASNEALVTITPPASGANGETNVVKVVATSLTNGVSSAALNLTVKLTNVRVDGVRVLTDTSTARVAPGGTRNFPFVVENSGNARARFVTGLSGVPLGWTASTTPASFELDGKSQAAAVMTLTAPADAVRGQTFSVFIRASGLDNAAVLATKSVPVEVFLADKFSFLLFDGVNADGTVKTRATTSVDAPQVHSLRDEGPDAIVGPKIFNGVVVPDQSPVGTAGTLWDDRAGEDGDKDYDQSTLFRLMLVNDGDRADTIRLLPKLITDGDAKATALASPAQKIALGYQDLTGCEEADTSNNNGDTHNDGWRFRLFDPTNTTQTPLPGRGRATVQTYDAVAAFTRLVPVPAHSTRYVYVEMGTYDGDPDSGSSDPCATTATNRIQGGGSGARAGDAAPGHAVAIEAISQNDPSQRGTHVLNAKVLGAGPASSISAGTAGTPSTRISSQRYSDQLNGVSIQADANQPTTAIVQSTGTLAQRTASYALRAVNTGDEMDTLRISVPQSEGGFDRTLSGFNTKLMFPNLVQGNTETPRAAVCTAPTVVASNIVVDCTMGAYDEVSFVLNSTAASGTPIGTLDTATVTATSTDSLAGSSALAGQVKLTTKALGAFAFNLLPDVTSIPVTLYAGGPASVSFTIDNRGTQSDHFVADLVTAPATSSGWSSALSQANPIFVAAGKQFNGVLSITAPANAVVGTQERFRLRVTSQDSPGASKPFDFIDVLATVAAKPTAFTLAGTPSNVGGLPGQTVSLTATATRAVGNTATGVTFKLDPASLPAGWSIVGITSQSASYAGNTSAATFQVKSPADALATSRAAVRIVADDSNSVELFTEIGVALSSPNLGILLSAPAGSSFPIAASSTAEVPIAVANRGIGVDGVILQSIATPTGWGVTFNPSTVGLQPLENRTVQVSVTAPSTVAPGTSRLITIKATPGDASQSQTMQLLFTVGTSVLTVTPKVNGTLLVAPEETIRFAATVANNGSLGDEVKFSIEAPQAFKDLVTATFTPSTLSLAPGHAAEVLVEAKLPASFVPGLTVPISVRATSVGPILSSIGDGPVKLKVLPFVAFDVDGDKGLEYAVDRDQNATNGFESFFDPSTTLTGSLLWNLDGLIGNATRVRLGLPATGTAIPFVDGDRDGKADFFVDRDADGQPDSYWDPDNRVLTPTTLRTDLVGTSARDIVTDLNGDGKPDAVYDPEQAAFVALLPVDINGDGVMDYAVDANGNHRVDAGEPVLFGGAGDRIVKIQRTLDVDGDGILDAVIDDNADGDPDFFLPQGNGTAIAIVLQDVNGDGVKDWTFDSNGDGHPDKYYDPVTGKTSSFTQDQAFLSGLGRYWYVGALLLVAAALFAVLLVTTRKKK